MSHEKRLQDGKLKKKAEKSLKERRLEKREKHKDEVSHFRKPRQEKNAI